MARENKNPNLPKYLYHYTDWAGLSGIWTSGALRATRYDGLNDKSEIEEFRGILEDHIAEKIRPKFIEGRERSTKLKRFISGSGGAHIAARNEAKRFVDILYKTTLTESQSGPPFAVPFITSFCSHQDDHPYEQKNGLLSQWRAYGGNERYAIVFDSISLEKMLRFEEFNFHYSAGFIKNIVYNRDVKIDDIVDSREIDKFSESIANYWIENEPNDTSDMFTPFITGCTRLKHQGFREEREFRIIACPFSQELYDYFQNRQLIDQANIKKIKLVNTRVRDNGMRVHYINLLEDRKTKSLPISKIIVGPNNDQIALAKKIRELTEGKVEIALSETPFIG